MEASDKLRFAVSDRINNVDVGLQHVPLNLLGDFQKEVTEFLQGSGRDVPPDVVVSLEEGSLALVATGLLAATGLWSDITLLSSQDSLGQIDPKRAAVIERWQAKARGNPHRVYALQDNAKRAIATVNKTTDFHKSQHEAWVSVEKYLHGKVMNWGGKTNPNVHLDVGAGKQLTIAATQQLLADEDKNRLYRSALLHVRGEENLRTGELRNLILLAFEADHPAYDEEEFQQMVRKGTAAWADVPNATQWVESLRGENA